MKSPRLPAVLVILVVSGPVFAQLSEMDRTSVFRDDIVRVGAPVLETTLCHIPPGNPENAHTIGVAQAAVPAHLAHGDALGTCSDEGDDEGNDEGNDEGDDEASDCPPYPAPVAATGQTGCWNQAGQSIDCAGTGQDGEHQAGAAIDPRFTDNGDGTVTDNLTGLLWLQQANCFDGTWSEALSFANALSHGSCGLSDGSLAGDWRLPNVKEGLSLFDYSEEFPALTPGHPFTGVPHTLFDEPRYWTSTNLAPVPGASDGAWRVDSARGELLSAPKSGDRRAWAVRDPLAAPTACGDFASPVPQTGQTSCWEGVAPYSPIDCTGTGQDGEYRAGVAAEPRFTDNGDGTVTDNLTGLIWLRQADCFLGRWADTLAFANTLSDGSCGLADGSLPGDWRLPNVREWHSLLDYGQTFPPLPPGHPFTGVTFTGSFPNYWASTTIPGSLSSAFKVNMQVGTVSTLPKHNSQHMLAVRP